jgi:signal transduction histidine kinase
VTPQRQGAPALWVIPSQVLQTAARCVVTTWRNEHGDAVDSDEVVDLLALLAAAVEAERTNRGGSIDERIRSSLGRRLLELLRAEVVRGWAGNGSGEGQLAAILIAMERVREAIEPDWAQFFASRLSGPDGLGLVVDIAHDLRSPLTSVLFLAETLQRGQSGSVNDVQRRQLGLIYSAALGLSSVASDIIELARGGDQLVETEPVPFSVNVVLESVRDIVRPMAEEKQLDVRLLPPTTDHRMGHPVALSRVLLNLTTNALKFTDQGYVEIETRELDASRVEFAVRDSGKGIDPAIVDTLYQPLRHIPGRNGRSFSQTGLGLTMCRKLVEAMGSELKVETRGGWGTRFFFELGLAPYAPVQAVRPSRPGVLGGRRVLRPLS